MHRTERTKRLEGAIREQLGQGSLTIQYLDGTGQVSRREITPVVLYLSRKNGIGVWAFCHERNNFRSFSLHRMQGVDPIPQVGKPITSDRVARSLATVGRAANCWLLNAIQRYEAWGE